MMSTSTQSMKKSRTANSGDRITNLHESVITHILSRLPTKDAIRTSILSKKWEGKWMSSCNVHIDYAYTHHSNKESFISLMDRIVYSPQSLRKFHFTCWGLRDLSCIPRTCAPNLTGLFLSCIEIVNENPNTSAATFNFPILKTLLFTECKWVNVKSVEIYAPSLTKFTSHAPFDYKDCEYSIAIVAPRLNKFSYCHSLVEKVLLNESPIVSADLFTEECLTSDVRLLKNLGLHVVTLINGFIGLEKLKLSALLAKVLLLGPPLRRYNKLLRLTLTDMGSPEQLLNLLHAAPSLKYLSVCVYEWNNYDYEAMEFMPSCIVSHLEKVVFRGFELKVPEYNFAAFLIKTARHLKKFVIHGHPRDSMGSKIRKVLLTFRKASPDLRIYVLDR